MHNLAVIDIGSNSLKMILVKIEENSFSIIDELKETVRLGDGMASSSKLKVERMDKAVKTLKLFKSLCDATETEDIITVATAAVRLAENKEEFLTRIEQEVGLKPQVLSGLKEGYYDYWGVVNSMYHQDGLIMDIGGGSIELIWIKERQIKEVVSLNFGVLNITQRFNLYEAITKEQEQEVMSYLKEAYQNVDWLAKMEHKKLLGVGGTLKNIAKIDQANKEYPLNLLHNYQMSSQDIKEIYNLVKTKSLAQRENISALSTERADMFIGATAAVVALIDHCQIEDFYLSRKGIREGLVYNYLRDSKQPVKNALNFSLQNLMNLFKVNQEHAYHIYKLTKSLYDQLKPLYKLNFKEFVGDIDKIILTAALMHDIGGHINYYDHHEHSFYMILNSEIDGLSHRELLLSAYIAASHRHKNYNLHKYNLNRANFKQIIDKNGADKELIRKVGILLEIAESLDRSQTGAVEAIQCKIKDQVVEMKILSRQDAEIEINDALKSAPSFKKLYDKELRIN